MGKKKDKAPRLDERALERFTLKMRKIAQEKDFQTPKQAELWLQEQFLAGDLEQFVTEPKTDLGIAQNLIWKAFEEPSKKKRISMAEEALKISADCADAYVLLAEDRAKDQTEAEEFYRNGIAAGRRALGDTAIKNLEKDFWNDYETRPFMRAVNGLANLLQDYSRPAEAIELWQELLRLNPGDDLDVRLRLMPTLVEERQFEEAKVLMDKFKFESTAAIAYSFALMLFKQNGDTVESRDALNRAMKTNTYVVQRLLSPSCTAAATSDEASAERDAEALEYAMQAYIDWTDTKGALEWLMSTVEEGVAKHSQKQALANTFPGLRTVDNTPDMLRVLTGLDSD